MIHASKGFILVKPIKGDSFFTTPDSKGNLRIGEIVEVGGNIIHASGKDLPAPVSEGKIIFQYIENQDITYEGQPYYLVGFNLVAGFLDK